MTLGRSNTWPHYACLTVSRLLNRHHVFRALLRNTPSSCSFLSKIYAQLLRYATTYAPPIFCLFDWAPVTLSAACWHLRFFECWIFKNRAFSASQSLFI